MPLTDITGIARSEGDSRVERKGPRSLTGPDRLARARERASALPTRSIDGPIHRRDPGSGDHDYADRSALPDRLTHVQARGGWLSSCHRRAATRQRSRAKS